MMPNATENKTEAPLTQEKIENVVKQPVEQNVTPDQSQTDNKISEETKEDPNWRAFREARKRDRAEREAAEKRAAEKEAEVAALKAAMEAAFAKNSSPQPHAQYQDPSYAIQEESEDERIEKKIQAAIAAREAAAEKARIEREQQEYPSRLRQTYPDFNAVVSPENLDYLEYHYPEVARPLKRQGEGYEKWSDIYLALKKFVPNAVDSKKEAARADANFAKPRSPSSPGMTQTTEVGIGARLSEERKRANWERMQKVLKGVG
jgi:hypothetical protein